MKNRFIFSVAFIVAVLVVAFFYNKYKVAPAIRFEILELTDLKNHSIGANI